MNCGFVHGNCRFFDFDGGCFVRLVVCIVVVIRQGREFFGQGHRMVIGNFFNNRCDRLRNYFIIDCVVVWSAIFCRFFGNDFICFTGIGNLCVWCVIREPLGGTHRAEFVGCVFAGWRITCQCYFGQNFLEQFTPLVFVACFEIGFKTFQFGVSL